MTQVITYPTFSFPLKKLWFAHVFILVLSNYAVQIPLEIFGIATTLGTFTYPLIFLCTDLTVRIFGKLKARKIVFLATMPGLVISYFVGTLFEHGTFQGFSNLHEFSFFVFRITIASLTAYLLGQLADILVSSIIGNLLDTYVFFAIAFYGTTDPYLAEHWFDIATFDYIVKICANMSIFIPAYGMLLKYIIARITRD